MSTRERILAVVLAAAIFVIGGFFLIWQVFLPALRGRNAEYLDLAAKLDKKQVEVSQAREKKAKLDLWRKLSLPSNVNYSWGEYEKFLSEQLRSSGFAAGSFSIKHKDPEPTGGSSTARIKKTSYTTKLVYTVQGHANLVSIVNFLERIYRTPLLHQVKSLVLVRPTTLRPDQRPDELDITTMTIEALVVDGAEDRRSLLPANAKEDPSYLAPRSRNYKDIAVKNIFFGPPPPGEEESAQFDASRYVYLNLIWQDGKRTEGCFYDRSSNKETRLRASVGFDSFRVRDDQGEALVSGKIIRINDRDLIFKVDEKYYSMHVGESLFQAMRTPLKEEEVKALGLVAAKP